MTPILADLRVGRLLRRRRLRQMALVGFPCLLVVAMQAQSGQAPAAGAQASAAGTTGAARVRIEMVVTPRDGATGTPHGEASNVLTVGRHYITYWSAGRPGNPELCDIGTISSESSGNPYYLWVVDAELLATWPQQTQLRLVWRRSVAGSGGMTLESQGTRTFTLGRDDEHVIDVARDARPESACANLVLRATAARFASPPLVPSLLTYDLTLVHRTRDGRQIVSRQQTTGPANADLHFYFSPLQWLPTGDFVDAATDPSRHVLLAVSGSVRGEPADDGSIQVSVSAQRTMSWGGDATLGQGTAVFATAPGEAVALDLPAPTGSVLDMDAGAGASPGPPAAGVSQRPGQTIIDFRHFFSGSQTSLYVTVRKER
jgi:hypothetical protein